MATLVDHARLALFVDQTWAVEITSLGITTNSGQNRVDLLNEGLAGFTPGSGDCELDVGFAVPIGGMENGPNNNVQQKCARGEYVSMQLIIGGQQYLGNGKILTVSINQSVNASVEGTLHWLGELKPVA